MTLMGMTDILLVALAKNLANQGQACFDVWLRHGEYQLLRSASRNDSLTASDWSLLAVVSPDRRS